MSSNKCKNAIVSKTMMIPVIIFNSSTTFEIKNGQLQKRYTNASSYTLLSEDSIISQSTKLFGQRTQAIGRSCTISTTSGNFLYEKYHFTFEGQIVLTETCPQNGSTIEENLTFDFVADIILPLTCSIN